MRRVLALTLVLAVTLAGCAQNDADEPTDGDLAASCDPATPPTDPSWLAKTPRVALTTSAGEIIIALDAEQAPITVDNFRNLVIQGTYEGTLFHRVIRGFVIQGGDPLSKDEDPANDGTGDAGYAIEDEFHPALRHEGEGILSMANSGPNTGGTQFFITLAATEHLNDRHSVFGRVVEGIEVVRAIGNAQVGDDDRPLEPVSVVKAEMIEPTSFEARHGAGIHVVIPSKKAEPGRAVRFAVILQNSGNTRDALALGATPPAGWRCATEAAAVVPAGTGRVVFLSLTPPAGASGTTSIPLHVRSASGASANATLDVVIAPLGAPVQEGTKVTANYAGLLLDGRLFDTSIQAVARDPAQPKFDTPGGFQDRGGYTPFPFTVGSGVIEGFTDLAKTAKVGEAVTGRIPAADAYARGNPYESPLVGRDLVFELEIVKAG